MSIAKRRILVGAVAVLLVAATYSSTTWAKDAPGYYTVPSIFQPAPNPDGKSWKVQNFGPVGIGIELVKPNFTMKISNVEKDSPAAATGKLEKGQIITSINGRTLKDVDPRQILGDIITDAEAKDGFVKLAIKDKGTVTVRIPVMGSYSDTWPLDCQKSDKIVRKLADLLAQKGPDRWGSSLFLLSTGEEKDLAVIRKWMAEMKDIGQYPWHGGYRGLAVCEYYLRTGDKVVLPLIEKYCQHLYTMMYNGGWSGRGANASFVYSTGTGQMNAAGVHCITFLMLAKMCGVNINEYMLQKSLKSFYRFAGHGNVPYGDGIPEGGFRDNGKTGGLAVAMAAAARLTPEGEDSVYAKARDHCAMKSFYATNWFHVAHTGGGIGEIWHNAAMSVIHKQRPTQYRSFLDTRRWVMELSRRHDGGIGIAGVSDRYDKSVSEDSQAWGTFFALTYTLPRQKLQLSGATKTQWCQSYQLPKHPWGNAADEVFLSLDPPKDGPMTARHMQDEKVETDASLPVLKQMNSPEVRDETLLKYVHHPEFGLRSRTMATITNLERYHLVLPLLKSADPRVRHAGILAMVGMFKGRAMPKEKMTPEMFELIAKMVADRNESLWLTKDALIALSKADPALIGKHRDRILELLKDDDWMIRSAAISALTPICTDSEHYQEVLPTVIKTLAEFKTRQALSPSGGISQKLSSANPTVKAFALEHLKKAYVEMPAIMTFPGGQTMANGTVAVRKMISDMMNKLPGGQSVFHSRPLTTLKSKVTGNPKDGYLYNGTFQANNAVIGSWACVFTSETTEDLEEGTKTWLKQNKKHGYKPRGKIKDTLQLGDGGKVKSDYFRSGYVWSDTVLINTDQSQAISIIPRTVDGVQFLFVERGGFDKHDGSKNWHCGYYAYVRATPEKKGSKKPKKKKR